MRKIIVYLAPSVEGYIARLDGRVHWLDRPDAAGDHGMAVFYKTIDTILWGYKTYESGVRNGPGFDNRVKNYLFSTRRPALLTPGVEFVNEPMGEFAQRIRTVPGKNFWMGMSGSLLPF